MININKLIVGRIRTNCYFLNNQNSSECVVIDPGSDADNIIEYITKNKLTPVAILLTHGHFDHIMAANAVKDNFNIPLYAFRVEKELLLDTEANGSLFYKNETIIEPDVFVTDGEELTIGGISIKVIYTPGHTHGSCCYYIPDEKVIFCGDTLFFRSVGRTDLATGNADELKDSVINKLMTLPDDVKAFTGHGPATTIGEERVKNPYIRSL